MPKLAQAVYQPSDPKWWRATAEAGDNERLEREREIDAAWRYYKGEQPMPLKRRPGDPDVNVILDLCGQAVDAMVAFLGAPELEVEGGGQGQPDALGIVKKTTPPQQKLLDDIWQANELELGIVDLLLSGSLAGHTFLKLLPPDAVAAADALPRAVLIDPRYMVVFHMDARTPLFYRMKWKDGDDTRTQDIVPGWLFEPGSEYGGWVIAEYVETAGRQMQPVGLDAWDYEFPPMVDWKNQPNPFEYYGRGDLPLVRRRKNDAANFVASNVQKIIMHHAGPQTVVTGGKLPDELDSSTVIDDLPQEAKVYNLEMASDLQSSANHLNMLRGAFFESVKVVDRASIKDKLGDLTNFAVRMLYGAQSDAAYQKQLLYGKGLRLASQALLALAGAPGVAVQAKWDDLLPQDRGALVTSVKTEADMGIVSDETLLEELGHDPAAEAQRKASEVNRQQDATANLLVRMGNRGLLSGGNGG